MRSLGAVLRASPDTGTWSGRVLQASILVRWNFLALGGIVGLLGGARSTLLLSVWLTWVAAYNVALIGLARNLEPSRAWTGMLAVLLLDSASISALIMLLGPNAPTSLYGAFVWVLIEGVAAAATAGGAIAVCLTLLSVTFCDMGDDLVWGGQVHLQSELGSWLLILLVTGLCLCWLRSALVAPSSPASELAVEAPPAAASVHLTKREREVLDLLSEGCSNWMIAERLHLSEDTVKTYVDSLFGRLGVRNRTQAVAVAFRLGLLSI